jgi:hypothetical protein
MWKRLWQLVTKGSKGAKQANMFRICKTNNMSFFLCVQFVVFNPVHDL